MVQMQVIYGTQKITTELRSEWCYVSQQQRQAEVIDEREERTQVLLVRTIDEIDQRMHLWKPDLKQQVEHYQTRTYEIYKHYDVYLMLEVVNHETTTDIDTPQVIDHGKEIWWLAYLRYTERQTHQHLTLGDGKMEFNKTLES